MDRASYNAAITDVCRKLQADIKNFDARRLDNVMDSLNAPEDDKAFHARIDARLVEKIRTVEFLHTKISNMAKGWPYEGEPNG